ncbi:hypothetical protein L1887_50699 [Cichorium endivia]|nr:hypothetical protein L1887_50699 [Cichorium endivia]
MQGRRNGLPRWAIFPAAAAAHDARPSTACRCHRVMPVSDAEYQHSYSVAIDNARSTMNTVASLDPCGSQGLARTGWRRLACTAPRAFRMRWASIAPLLPASLQP